MPKIRMAVYVEEIKQRPAEVWFVRESEGVIEELKKRSGVRTIRPGRRYRYDGDAKRAVDVLTGEAGLVLTIWGNLVGDGDLASARVSWNVLPDNGGMHHVRLWKKGNRWVVVK